MILGQSNPDGRANNPQSYSHATLKAWMWKNNLWRNLTDPTGQDPTGSVWPLLATHYLAHEGKPFAIIPAAQGGTRIDQWLPGTSLYNRMKDRVHASGGRLKAAICWLGESDADELTSQANFESRLDTLANAIYNDFGIPLLMTLIQTSSTGAWDATAVNAAILSRAASNPHLLPPVDLRDLLTDDADHIRTDVKLTIVAQRYWNALNTWLHP